MSESDRPEYDNSWEEHSVDVEVTNLLGSDSFSSDNISSPEQEDESKDHKEYKVWGAERYHFQHMPTEHHQDPYRAHDGATTGERGGEGDQDHIINTAYYIQSEGLIFWTFLLIYSEKSVRLGHAGLCTKTYKSCMYRNIKMLCSPGSMWYHAIMVAMYVPGSRFHSGV